MIQDSQADAVSTSTTGQMGNKIVQTGTVDFTGNRVQTWTFPQAFPTAVLYCNCCVNYPNTDATANLNATPTTTSATFRLNLAASPVTGYCIAVGY